VTGELRKDRFGNVHAPGLPYARGELIADTQDDIQKLRAAWALIRKRVSEQGHDAVFNLSGLERGFHYNPDERGLLDDELAAALHIERLTELGLEHLGGVPDRHDIMLLNRQTAALLVATLIMARPGDTVIGVSPSYSHPAVTRAAAQAGAHFVDTAGVEPFESALGRVANVSLVVLTRLAVSYEILSIDEIEQIVALARRAKAKVLVDDAGGARVGPAVFGQPQALELGVDVVATGLDKYGTLGPRLGLLGGERELVERIRVRAIEMGLEARPMLYPAVVQSLEQYDPERVRALVAMTREVVDELKSLLGAERVTETPVIGQLRGEDILEMAMERAGLSAAPIVPYEATAALAMLLLRDHGILTVHFAGLPPGTSALLIKFLPPETVARFGGARRLARAFDDALNTLSGAIADPVALRQLILGEGKHPVAVASG
jgi:L-seryl-tRNA(Ser) seleniumtransferase